MKLLLLSLYAVFLLPFADWSTDFDKAKTTAKQEQKLILLNFSGSDWCVPCIKMKKEIFESPDFSQFADNKLVLLKADFPRLKKNKLAAKQVKHNEQLAEKYNPKGAFPFTVLLDADGKVLKTWDGMPKTDAEGFVNTIKQVANGDR
jgi:thioredoxin-related protein